ncbi:Histidinol dehydrogenase [Anaerohalosphaera lusitana]|uniref:Histidinol dehydrogenase n=1 Tax=Anaerohalosphaera lusitana TaxID=1936003 RepID=A0A1U9NKM9_9BACT|nr:histidinol dehydrogenase [Anaerohalosphaera lusitana]AQT68365.1 Histidinol dehydrogenase [Anaerohalosphaera lusitana]
MKCNFEDILLLSSEQNFEQKIENLRGAILDAAYWPDGDDRHGALDNIIKQVKDRGDDALQEFGSRFDGADLMPADFRVTAEELKAAHSSIDGDLLKAIRQSIDNVRKYQSEIFVGDKNSHPGIKYTPISRVGVCVPGASAPLPSTVIMTAVPAQVAGVKEIAVVSPPRYKGNIHPVILAACHEIGVTEVYKLGGAHAVAALAYGTDTIERVYKIVGPGSTWVQLAKRMVFGLRVDIDSIAGPSEVLVVANKDANPDWVAADMLSQAEHAPGSAIVFTDSQRMGHAVLESLSEQVEKLDRSEDTIRCLKEYSGVAVFDSMEQVIEHTNDFAAEHLQIQCGGKSREVADRIDNAGAIFIGPYTPVAVGDYWAGPSHTLPTGTSAKFFSALSSNDFVKSTSIIEYDQKKLAENADDIVRLAMTEGLDAHAKSVKIRLEGK